MANILDPTDTAANARMQKTVQDAMIVQDSTPLGNTNEPLTDKNGDGVIDSNDAGVINGGDFQTYTEEDLRKAKKTAGHDAICAALQKDPNATQFKYGGSMYNIPPGTTC